MRIGSVSNIKNHPPPHSHKYSTDLQKKYDLRNHSRVNSSCSYILRNLLCERKTIMFECSFFTDSVRYGERGHRGLLGFLKVNQSASCFQNSCVFNELNSPPPRPRPLPDIVGQSRSFICKSDQVSSQTLQWLLSALTTLRIRLSTPSG